MLIRLHIAPSFGGAVLSDIGPLDIQRLYGRLLAPDCQRTLSAGSVLNAHLVLTQAGLPLRPYTREGSGIIFKRFLAGT